MTDSRVGDVVTYFIEVPTEDGTVLVETAAIVTAVHGEGVADLCGFPGNGFVDLKSVPQADEATAFHFTTRGVVVH